MRIRGELPVEVFAATDSTFMLSLPRHGRMQLSSLFPLLNQPDIDIGITGDWSRPDIFQVDVDAGPNGAEWRIDIASQTSPIPRACSGGTTKASARCCSEPTWGRKPTSRSGHSSSVPWWVQLSH